MLLTSLGSGAMKLAHHSQIRTICNRCFNRILHANAVSSSPLAFQTNWLAIKFYSTEAQHSNEKSKVELKDLKKKPRQFTPVSWKSFFFSLTVGSVLLAILFWQKIRNDEEKEKRRRRAIGKSLIGGPWELQNTKGELKSNKDFEGNWILIYFGFTHCPDICPDELEKMCKTADLLEKDSPHPVIPMFFTVDPARDTAAAVKKYCEEFSPKLMGFTGSKEQVEKVSRTFRVYHSEGPRDEFNDYIVDHTVIMYLMDPSGHFVDYYGQNRKAEEVAEAIKLQMLKYDKGKKKGWW